MSIDAWIDKLVKHPRVQKALLTAEAAAENLAVLRSEYDLRSGYPVGPVAWDQHVTLTVAPDESKLFRIVDDTGKLGVAVTVLDAGNSGQLGVNGSEPIPAVDGRAWDSTRISHLRLTNGSGSDDLSVVVFLGVTKATGRGAWASRGE